MTAIAIAAPIVLTPISLIVFKDGYQKIVLSSATAPIIVTSSPMTPSSHYLPIKVRASNNLFQTSKPENINLISPMELKKENPSLNVELSHSSTENLSVISSQKITMFTLSKSTLMLNQIANMPRSKFVVETELPQHGSELCNSLS